jgi:hypothetical protein
LLSGGLDSTLAVKLMIDQGINVTAVHFTSLFCNCMPKRAGCKMQARKMAEELDVPIHVIRKGMDESFEPKDFRGPTALAVGSLDMESDQICILSQAPPFLSILPSKARVGVWGMAVHECHQEGSSPAFFLQSPKDVTPLLSFRSKTPCRS